MSNVEVNFPHSLSKDEAKGKIASFEEMLKKYGVKADWKGHAAKLKGLGVSGSINVTDSDVAIVVKLGMMAKAAGVDPVRLKASIEKRLNQAFS